MKHSPGYIALTSAIITSVLIMIVVFAMSGAAILNRFNILDSTHKEESLAFSEACVEVALLRLAQNPGYAGSETLLVDEGQCQIFPLEMQGNERIIKAEADSGGAVSRLRVVVESQSLDVNSWEEVFNF